MNIENYKDLCHNLRSAELKTRKKMNTCRNLYRKECRTNKLLHKQLKKCKDYLINAQNQYDKLYSKWKITRNATEKCHSKRKRKSWCKVKCDRTKCRRLDEYGDFIFDSLNGNFPLCKRAQFSMWLADKTVNYSWTSKNFKMYGQASN